MVGHGYKVYVYEGFGASPGCTSMLLSSLRRCLCQKSHSIELISPKQVKQGRWKDDCSALVFGGGFDKGFLAALGEEGTDMIRRFVLQGGVYVGMCAGAYFACDSIEFEKGSNLAVCGPRPLKFYPGKCVGSIAPNFTYSSERGATAMPISIPSKWLPGFSRENTCTMYSYVNGGGIFSPYPSLDGFPDIRSVENLALFNGVEGRPPAVVKCEIGDRGGMALLSSPHLEFAAFEMPPTDQHLMEIQRPLRRDDRIREQFLKSFLRLGNLRLAWNSSL